MDQNKILKRKRLEVSDLEKQIELLQNYKKDLSTSIQEIEEAIENASNPKEVY